MTEFRYDAEFLLDDIADDQRFRSRLDLERMSENVEMLKADIEQRGQIDPVGVARLVNEDEYVLIYGFTRAEAIRRLGWNCIKANVYDDLSETEVRILNAANNSMREDLNPWERALQLKTLRQAGVPVETGDPQKDSISKLMKMSRRSVFNWLRVVEYGSEELHKAIASGKLTLKHALEFVGHEPEFTVAMLDRCVQEQWSSTELRLRLNSATLPGNIEYAGTGDSHSATLHGEDNPVLKDEDVSQVVSLKAMESIRRFRSMLYDENKIAALGEEKRRELFELMRRCAEILMRREGKMNGNT